MKVVITKDYTEMCKLASRIFAAEITLKPDCVLGLATGSTPVGMYKELVEMYNEHRVDFSQVKTVNLDEYAGLSGDNDQSYRYFMNHNLFDHININKENTNVPNGTAADLEAECERYEQVVASMGGVDVQLLGIGNNGHIAFNEPCEEFPEKTHVVNLTQNTIEANARFFASMDDVPKKALTMGIGTIMKAKKIPVYLTILAVVLAAAVVTVFATQAEPATAPEAPAAPVQTAQPEAKTPDEVTLEIPQTASIEESQPADAAPEPAAQLQYVFPLEDADAAVLQSFGYRDVAGVSVDGAAKQAFHAGVDLEAAEESSVLAVADGTVAASTYDMVYGNQITIQHADGMLTTYSHLSERLVSEGDSVRQGQIIGRSGATGWVTGPHLHLDVQVNGEYVDPLEALG